MKRILVTVSVLILLVILLPGAFAEDSGLYQSSPTEKTIGAYSVNRFISDKGAALNTLDDTAAHPETAVTGTFLKKVGSYTKLLQMLHENGVFNDYMGVIATPDTNIIVPKTDGPAAETAQDHSTTNVQVQGVDEADVIKVDGGYIYAMFKEGYVYDLSNPNSIQPKVNSVAIVKADGDKMSVVSRINSNSSDVMFDSMYLDRNRLVIIARNYDNKFISNVYVYDVSNKSAPALVRYVKMDGFMEHSRLYNGTLYFVTSSSPAYVPLAKAKLSDALPNYLDSAVSGDKLLVPCENIYYEPDRQNYGTYTNICALDTASKAPLGVKTVYGASFSGLMYMNGSSLYLAGQNYLSNASQTSRITRFALNKTGVTPAAAVNLSGTILNQYSMDEYNGMFRVALTDGEKGSKLCVFDQNLKPVGEASNLAKGERIYSVRFMGDTAYVVTFLNMDPLFVIDLSSPANPKVLGQLKVPGFSNYLHPFKDKYLIGIGREIRNTYYVDDQGKKHPASNVDTGLKLSLFDVSNPRKPKEVAKQMLGGAQSYTNSAYEPKSIMIDKSKGIMAFPMSYDSIDDKVAQIGIVIQVDAEKGFKTLARLPQGEGYLDNSRLCFIGNTLYMLSGGNIQAYDYSTFEKLAQITIN